MQKIDFVQHLENLVLKLKSREITEEFENGFNSPHKEYFFNRITPLLFSSKSNYDQIKDDEKYADILISLNAAIIYIESALSDLTTIFVYTSAPNILLKPDAIKLYNFHKTLILTSKLSKDVLQGPNITENLENEIENGIVLFQILIEEEGLQTEKYIKIFSAIKELIEKISSVQNEEEYKSEIILLDSGSDTNFVMKTGIETAKSLFQIFKEVWDFILNHKYYKNNQNNNALIESLSIRTLIKEKVDNGILTEKEGKEYIHYIKSRTNDLIGMKVLPKKLFIESNNLDNKKLLADLEGTKLLKDSE